jgi:hypothetical protein
MDEMRDEPQTPADEQIPQTSQGKKKIWKEFRARIDACKTYRRKLAQTWAVNIDYRRGKPFQSQSDQDRVNVNLDWSLTKSKIAALFSQMPEVHVDHHPQTQLAGPWLAGYEQRLNDTLVVAGIESAMDECLADCINAAGVGIVMVSHDVITVPKQVPKMDLSRWPPQLAQQAMQTGFMPDGSPLEMDTIPEVVDHRYTVDRISPSDFLWPINFALSDFDKAPWLGRTGRVSWAEGVHRFKLREDQKRKVLGEERSAVDRLVSDTDRERALEDESVEFDEIYYKEFQYDSEAMSYVTLHHLVFVHGIDDPVIDEPWKGQRLDEKTKLVLGAQKNPVRVLTLSYLTDEAIPPSDTAIGRPQIDEINKSRTQMIQQRERSLPIRWFDVNRIDPIVQVSLMRGTWQNMIPVQGQGANVVGEVARASHPQEDFTFDRIAKADLLEMWQISPNQEGQITGETAAETKIVQQELARPRNRERAKVAKFFVSVAEVLGGLLCLYEPTESFGEGFDPVICRTLSYSILADSTVLIDSNQRLERLINFVNFGAKSGWVDIEPVMKEIATLSGLDPNVVIKPPTPKPPVEPNISLRLTGTEDMMNPLTLAFLMKSGQAPGPDLIEQAKQLIQTAVTPPPNAAIPPPMPMMPPEGGEGGPEGPPPLPPGVTPAMPPMPTAPGMMNQAVTPPGPPAPRVGEAHPQWVGMPAVNKRSDGKKGN